MTLPAANILVSVTRQINADPNSEQDLDSETDYTPPATQTVTIQKRVRAVIALGSGERTFGPGGEIERTEYKFSTDQLRNGNTILGEDILIDEQGNQYIVIWSQPRSMTGLSIITGVCYQETL
jgi:hypothetical protein